MAWLLSLARQTSELSVNLAEWDESDGESLFLIDPPITASPSAAAAAPEPTTSAAAPEPTTAAAAPEPTTAAAAPEPTTAAAAPEPTTAAAAAAPEPTAAAAAPEPTAAVVINASETMRTLERPVVPADPTAEHITVVLQVEPQQSVFGQLMVALYDLREARLLSKQERATLQDIVIHHDEADPRWARLRALLETGDPVLAGESGTLARGLLTLAKFPDRAMSPLVASASTPTSASASAPAPAPAPAPVASATAETPTLSLETLRHVSLRGVVFAIVSSLRSELGRPAYARLKDTVIKAAAQLESMFPGLAAVYDDNNDNVRCLSEADLAAATARVRELAAAAATEAGVDQGSSRDKGKVEVEDGSASENVEAVSDGEFAPFTHASIISRTLEKLTEMVKSGKIGFAVFDQLRGFVLDASAPRHRELLMSARESDGSLLDFVTAYSMAYAEENPAFEAPEFSSLAFGVPLMSAVRDAAKTSLSCGIGPLLLGLHIARSRRLVSEATAKLVKAVVLSRSSVAVSAVSEITARVRKLDEPTLLAAFNKLASNAEVLLGYPRGTVVPADDAGRESRTRAPASSPGTVPPARVVSAWALAVARAVATHHSKLSGALKNRVAAESPSVFTATVHAFVEHKLYDCVPQRFTAGALLFAVRQIPLEPERASLKDAIISGKPDLCYRAAESLVTMLNTLAESSKLASPPSPIMRAERRLPPSETAFYTPVSSKTTASAGRAGFASPASASPFGPVTASSSPAAAFSAPAVLKHQPVLPVYYPPARIVQDELAERLRAVAKARTQLLGDGATELAELVPEFLQMLLGGNGRAWASSLTPGDVVGHLRLQAKHGRLVLDARSMEHHGVLEAAFSGLAAESENDTPLPDASLRAGLVAVLCFLARAHKTGQLSRAEAAHGKTLVLTPGLVSDVLTHGGRAVEAAGGQASFEAFVTSIVKGTPSPQVASLAPQAADFYAQAQVLLNDDKAGGLDVLASTLLRAS